MASGLENKSPRSELANSNGLAGPSKEKNTCDSKKKRPEGVSTAGKKPPEKKKIHQIEGHFYSVCGLRVEKERQKSERQKKQIPSRSPPYVGGTH